MYFPRVQSQFHKECTYTETYVTWSGKTNLIADDSRIYFFSKNVKLHKIINYQFFLNKLDMSGLLLLAAFPKHSGDLYERSGAPMKLWPSWGWLCVAVQLPGIEKRPVL